MDDNFSDKVAFGVMCQLVIGSSATSMYLCIKRIGKKNKFNQNANEQKRNKIHVALQFSLSSTSTLHYKLLT